MADFNKVIISGYIKGTPKVYTFENGSRCARAVLTTSTPYKDQIFETNNFIAIYGERADLLSVLADGTRVFVEGKIQTRKTDDGKYITEVVILNLET